MADGQALTRPDAKPQQPVNTAALVPFEQMEKMAEAFAKSNLFGVKTKDAALALLMIAQAEGIHPALAVMEYDIIEGKPARKAERILARFQASGGKVEWLVYTDTGVKAKFSHPQGAPVEIEWTIAHAAKIKYYKRGGEGGQGGWYPLVDKYNWKNYPRAMLRSRCIAEGVRACYPGTGLVLLSTEEATDYGTLESEPLPPEAEATHAIEQKSAYQARKDGDWPRLMKVLSECDTEEEIGFFLDANRDAIAALPPAWRDRDLPEEIAKRKEAFGVRDASDRDAGRVMSRV